ncbi:MAG: 50S ribosomal protein L11 methyltransferase [Polyangiales bacterium]
MRRAFTIAALLLGTKDAVGTDIEEDALRIARENADQNGWAID